MGRQVTERELRASIAEELRKLKLGTESLGANYDQWLQKLYDRHSERLLQDNERIWRTAAIFIPTALVGFTVLPAAYEKEPLVALVIGIISCAVIVLWNAIADEHRAFQMLHGMWLDEIRVLIGMTNVDAISGKNLARGGLARVLPSVRHARYAFAALAIVLWIGVGAVGVYKHCAISSQHPIDSTHEASYVDAGAAASIPVDAPLPIDARFALSPVPTDGASALGPDGSLPSKP